MRLSRQQTRKETGIMIGPILMSVAKATGPTLGRIFVQRAVEAAATVAATTLYGSK